MPFLAISVIVEIQLQQLHKQAGVRLLVTFQTSTKIKMLRLKNCRKPRQIIVVEMLKLKIGKMVRMQVMVKTQERLWRVWREIVMILASLLGLKTSLRSPMMSTGTAWLSLCHTARTAEIRRVSDERHPSENSRPWLFA